MRFGVCSVVYRSFCALLILMLGLKLAVPAVAGTDQWTSNGPYGGQVRVLAIDPKTPSTLYAAAPGGGVFKSTDGAADWARASSGITDLSVRALAIDPQNTATLYAATDQGGGLYRSTDGGNSWVNLQSVPGVANGVAIDSQTPTTIYVAEEQAGLLKSTDGGATFDAIGTGLPNSDTFIAIVIDPKTTSTLYVADQSTGLFKSTDGGTSWASANGGLSGSSINIEALIIDPQTTSTLYAAIDTGSGKLGLYKSTNGAGSWTLAATLGIDDGNGSLAINPQSTSTLYAGGFGLGVLQSTNGGTSFAPVKSGLTNLNVLALAVNPQSPATIYAGTQAGIFATGNAGAAWTAENSGLALTPVRSVVVDPNTPTTVYAGTGVSGTTSIFKSTDDGNSWTAINTGLTPSSLSAELTQLAIDPQNSSHLYAGGTGGFGLFVSTNGGASWTPSTNGLSQFATISDIEIDATTTPSTLYAGTSSDGVFKSTDGGTIWSAANNGLPAGEAVARLGILVPKPGSPSFLLLVTQGGGLYSSNNGAGSWTPIGFTVAGSAVPGSNGRPKALPLPITPEQQNCINSIEKSNQAFMGWYNFEDAGLILSNAEIFIACISPLATPTNITPGSVRATNGLIIQISNEDLGFPAAQIGSGTTKTSQRAGNRAAASGSGVTDWAPPDGATAAECSPPAGIVANPLDLTTFFMGGACGVLQGSNLGTQLVSMSLGLPPNLQVNALGITPTASDLYAGTNSGVYRYTFADSPLAAAVLPSSRSVEVGATATAFATLINGSTGTAKACGLALSTPLPAGFSYQTTAAGTNALTGAPDTPVDIPAGGLQTFIFSLTPDAAIPNDSTATAIDTQIDFNCAGLSPVAVEPGIDTLLLSASASPVPDIVALAATASNDGIVHIPGATGSAAFAVATIDLGSADTITASPQLSSASLPLTLAVCQTNPTTGQCLAPAAASVATPIAAGATPTFAFFAGASGSVPLQAVSNRIFVQFVDSTGAVRGATSVAVETQ